MSNQLFFHYDKNKELLMLQRKKIIVIQTGGTICSTGKSTDEYYGSPDRDDLPGFLIPKSVREIRPSC